MNNRLKNSITDKKKVISTDSHNTKDVWNL